MRKFHICKLYRYCQNKECSHTMPHDRKKDCNNFCGNSTVKKYLTVQCIEVKYK